MNAYTLAGLPAAVLAACYLIAGEFWIAIGIAAAGAIVALGVTLSDTLQRLADSDADNVRLAGELDAAYARLNEVLDKAALAPAPVVELTAVDKFSARMEALRESTDRLRPDLRVIPPQRTSGLDQEADR